jgi:hypothetical protein
MLSILNTSNPLSRNQILLALYEGESEEYEIVKTIFQPVIDKIYNWASSINNNSKNNNDDNTNSNNSSNSTSTNSSIDNVRIFVGGDMDATRFITVRFTFLCLL